LQAIAQSFNEFVGHLEAFVRREKSLLNLASHELRTPLAVVSGALDILAQRGSLSHDDQTTVARIRRATEEMQSNVDILLALARKDQGASVVATSVSLSTEVNRVLDDLSGSYPVQSRVELRAFAPGQVVADATMVRMLLRNLVQNALQHTRRRVFITVHADYFDVRDEGEGLSSQAQDVLAGRVTLGQEPGAVHGLGLYLVTLMIERLGWTLQVVEASSQGTLLRVFYPQA
jgi:signal transduction histidine kinase